MMTITRRSPVSGKVRTLTLPVTEAQMAEWESGTPIQRVMPHLSPEDREFIISGITGDEWNAEFGEEDEEG